MEFSNFRNSFQENFNRLVKEKEDLYIVDLDKDRLWDIYLESFPEGANKMFRERREYDCQCCKQFIRYFGGVVVLENNVPVSIWDFKTNVKTFQPVIDAMSSYIKTLEIKDVFYVEDAEVGTEHNFERLASEEVRKWEHFYLDVPQRFVGNFRQKSLESQQGEIRTTKEMLERGMLEITKESVGTVIELIEQNSLYKGEEWSRTLKKFLRLQKDFKELKAGQEGFLWSVATKDSKRMVCRLRNTSIGTLLVDISEGMALDLAVSKYEKIVAPENYKRPKPIYTKAMLERAEEKVKELGLMDSLPRRMATLDDITVNNILFSNRDSAKRISGNVFEEMAEDIGENIEFFSKVEEVTIDKFVNTILPKTKKIELLFENRMIPNLMSLIAPKVKGSKNMFKWDNPFSWAYKGNIADSSMRERVKMAGGNVEGVLRFSIQWNDKENTWDRNDLDAHCIEPSGNLVFFGNKNSRLGGGLDVDIMSPRRDTPAVENIAYENLSTLEEGVYEMYVHNYANRGGKGGFRAEIEFDGKVYEFDYNKEVRHKERICVAKVKYSKSEGFEIVKMLPSVLSTQEVWNLKTSTFVPVSVVMNSPNYWDEQKGIGNKHYFFMLKNCINNEEPNGFYNEFLKEELMEYRRVFEALGSKMSVEVVDDQLSGVGFSTTQDNLITLKVTGETERFIKVRV